MGFFFSSLLLLSEVWCIAFGWNLHTHCIRITVINYLSKTSCVFSVNFSIWNVTFRECDFCLKFMNTLVFWALVECKLRTFLVWCWECPWTLVKCWSVRIIAAQPPFGEWMRQFSNWAPLTWAWENTELDYHVIALWHKMKIVIRF